MAELTMDQNLDCLWLLLGAFLVFLMQCGFALLEAGSVRMKNTAHIFIKNIVNVCVGGLVWWAVGYPFAYGDGGAAPNGFIGGTNFFMSGFTNEEAGSTPLGLYYADWMFNWAFATIAAAIASGSVAERCTLGAYFVYAVALTAFIYPVVVHWGWSSEGWLSPFRASRDQPDVNEPLLGANGFIDFSGSAIIHMTGGGAGLMGALFLGPRLGRFLEDGSIAEIPAHSLPLVTTGTFMLWFGWYGFNPVSTLAFESMEIASRIAVTTTLAPCAGGTAALVISIIRAAKGNTIILELQDVLNGILAGLVSITAPCAVVEPYAAVIIGSIAGGAVYPGACMLLRYLKIDDPIEASPVHFFCGAWGCIAAGLFATQFNVATVYGTSSEDYGVFYGGGGKQFAVQMIGVIIIALWTCTLSGIMFGILKYFDVLRISKEAERAGLDLTHHGNAPAYNIQGSQKDHGIDLAHSGQ